MKFEKIIYGLAVSAFAMSSVAYAAEFKPASVRALGMGGSNVASTNGVDASYWNPAAYGFFGNDDASAEAKALDNNSMSDKDFGLDAGVGLGYYLFGPIAGNVSTLQNLSIPTGSTTAGLNSAEIVDFANFSNDFQSLDPAAGGVNVSADAVLGARVSNYGVGIRSSADINVSVSFDNQNTGLGADFFTALTATPTALPPGATPFFNAAEQSVLEASLVSAGMGAANATIVATNYNNALTAEAFNDPTLNADQAQMSAALVDLYTAPGDLQNNGTTIETRGVAITEVGITYGYAFDEALSVGAVVKYLQADMIVDSADAFTATDTLSTAQDAAGVESVTGFGLDLGVMYRIPDWQFGLTVKNLNSPSFEHSSGYVYEMKPQAKVGAAWIPSDTFTLEAAVDLTENEGAVENSLSQYWNVGLEWDAWKVLALRVGAFQNIAETDIGLVPTVGLGLNLWAMRLDIGLAVSTNTVVLDGDEIPAYAMGSLALAVDF